MKKIETVLLVSSVVNGLILAVLDSIKPFSYIERTGLACLITVSTVFLLRKKLIHIYKENTRTYSLWTIEFYSGRSVKKIFAQSYLLLISILGFDWALIPKFHISNFLEYFIYYTILQFCRLLFLSYIFLHLYHLKHQKSQR